MCNNYHQHLTNKVTKNNRRHASRRLYVMLEFPFSGGVSFLFALNARFFIVFAFAYFTHNSGAGTLFLKAFQSTFEGFAFPNFYFGHLIPSLRSHPAVTNIGVL